MALIGGVNTSDAQQGDVTVRVAITYPQGGGDVRATLHVEDRLSGEELGAGRHRPHQLRPPCPGTPVDH